MLARCREATDVQTGRDDLTVEAMAERLPKFTPDAQRMVAIVSRFEIGGIVMGLPLNMDGSEGPRAQATRSFVRNLAPLTPLPIVLWDERMSTMAAERAMIEADMSRKKRAEKIDAVAAS